MDGPAMLDYPWLALNAPKTGPAVVARFRWALLGDYLADAQPPGPLFALSVAITLLVLATGLVFFRRTERTFADIV